MSLSVINTYLKAGYLFKISKHGNNKANLVQYEILSLKPAHWNWETTMGCIILRMDILDKAADFTTIEAFLSFLYETVVL